MKLLLISNSTNAGEQFLEYAIPEINKFLGGIKKVLFIPYAAISISFDAFSNLVKEKFTYFGCEVDPIHLHENPVHAINETEAIVVGGGNTFHLINLLQFNGLIEPLREKVKSGIPYIGWSAGANIACPTICTTNDMPVIEPESFEALNLVPFQINPHFHDKLVKNHAGESRETRIEEYIEVNPDKFVIGLREGTMLSINFNEVKLIGSGKPRIFKKGMKPVNAGKNHNLDYLLA